MAAGQVKPRVLPWTIFGAFLVVNPGSSSALVPLRATGATAKHALLLDSGDGHGLCLPWTIMIMVSLSTTSLPSYSVTVVSTVSLLDVQLWKNIGSGSLRFKGRVQGTKEARGL